MSKIELRNVTKKFGDVTALKNVNITFEENVIYGLLGRNGAGKSTMLNLISNKLFVTEGEILVDGEKTVENDKALSKIYCMSDCNLYPDSCKVKEIFETTKIYYPDFDMDYAMKLAENFELNTAKKIKTLSTGYKSIYKLIIALSCGAPIVFLDEPVLGLDANHRDMFYRSLIERYSDKPATYVISTHLIEEAADVIERCVIIKDGEIIRNEDVSELVSQGYAISGSTLAVDEYCAGKEVIGETTLGNLKTAYILGSCDAKNLPPYLELSKLDLQKLFIQLTNI